MAEPIQIFIPPTLERPPMILEGKVVEELPPTASVGDLVTYRGRLWYYLGALEGWRTRGGEG